MGIVNPSNKPNGTTNWVNGDTVDGPGLIADINLIFNEFNGNIETENLSPNAGIVGTQLANETLTNTQVALAANILPTKVDDYSASNLQQNTFSNPGTSASNTLAVLLTKELEQLRYVLRRTGLGANAKITDGATSGLKADGNAAWFDGSVIGASVIRNGAFLGGSVDDSAASSAANPPFGWTTLNTPSTLARVALDVTEGDGEAIHIVDDAVGSADGISQTLVNLRASSLYLVVCRIKPITSVWNLITTGATGTFGNLNLLSASGGSLWQTLSGVIATDATPTNVVLTLRANAAAAACHVSLIDVLPLGDDRIDRGRSCVRTRQSTSVAEATVTAETTLSVVCPGPGYHIDVTAVAAHSAATQGYLEESVDGAAPTNVGRLVNATGGIANSVVIFGRHNPVPGSKYQYRLGPLIGGGYTIAADQSTNIRVELKRA